MLMTKNKRHIKRFTNFQVKSFLISFSDEYLELSIDRQQRWGELPETQESGGNYVSLKDVPPVFLKFKFRSIKI